MERPEDVPTEIKELVVYEYGINAASSWLGFGPESLEHPDPVGHRVRRWEASDEGVRGRSSAIGRRRKETPETGMVWARHCAQEVGTWGVFLPELSRLSRVVGNTDYDLFADLTAVTPSLAGLRLRLRPSSSVPTAVLWRLAPLGTSARPFHLSGHYSEGGGAGRRAAWRRAAL